MAHHRLKMAVATATLLVVAAVAYRSIVELPGPRSAAQEPASPAQRLALQQCAEAAYMIHDVRWAAACMVVAEQDEVLHAACVNDPDIINDPQLGKRYCESTFGLSDGSAECTLPDARAATLDALLVDAEQKCRAEAMAGSHLRPSD